MKILILTGYIPNIENIEINKNEFDFIIAADKGYEYSAKIGIHPDLIIGDFDTAVSPTFVGEQTKLITLPAEKDMTDTEAALDIAATKQPSSITILGGLGGRFDHTMGNISLLSKYDLPITIRDEKNSVILLRPGRYFVAKNEYKYISLVPFTPSVSGLSIKGAKYSLNNAELTHDNTLGISNEIIGTYAKNNSTCDSFTNNAFTSEALSKNTSPTCEISFKRGQLLVCQSND